MVELNISWKELLNGDGHLFLYQYQQNEQIPLTTKIIEHKKGATTYGAGNPGPVFRHPQQCGRVKTLLMESQPFHSWWLDLQRKHRS